MSKYNNYIVYFMPDGYQTVDMILTIDAWSSTGGVEDARQELRRKVEAGEYKQHGKGRFTVAKLLDSVFSI